MTVARKSPRRKAGESGEGSMPHVPGVIWLTPEEAWAMYEAAAREGLGMSADEAEAAWAAGEFDDRIEEPAVLRLYFARVPKPSAS